MNEDEEEVGPVALTASEALRAAERFRDDDLVDLEVVGEDPSAVRAVNRGGRELAFDPDSDGWQRETTFPL